VKPLGIVGNLARDRLSGGPPTVGGGPFHAGRALRALGRRGVLVTKCTEADRRDLLTPLIGLGLPVLWHAAASTSAFAMAYDGDRRRMIVEALGEPWTPEEARGWVARALAGVEWVHVAPLARSDFPPETLAELARGRRLSLDGQGLVRGNGPGPLELDAEYDPALLHHVSILKLAEEEAQVLVEGLDERALRRLGVPEVIVTLGSRGAVVLADGLAELVPARRVPGDPDPTGSGDAFAAAYLAARAGGESPPSAARRASALVSMLLAGRAS
jgi:sugar/nucleoside kinase (ribokinase family)